MDETVRVRLPESDVKDIDNLVSGGKYLNKSDAARDLIRLGLRVKKGGNCEIHS